MKIGSRFAFFALLLACTATPALSQHYYYIRSNAGQPWGQTSNEDAMDNVFGSSNWTTLYYETLNVNQIFNSGTTFIFMEGGDSSFNSFQSFMQTNLGTIYTWINSGGMLLIMSAPNNPLSGAIVPLPDNIILSSDAFYESAASSANAIDISNSIFNTPNSAAYSFTGDFFSHGYFVGNNVTALMESNLNEIVLGQDAIGSGLMVFGGLTTDNFQQPQPAAHSLLENIIYYTAFY
ncbi:MAG TPA: hypothetical protein VGL72_05355 [Bryobacteraceae bacterium]|jgi:hypothetical protein